MGALCMQIQMTEDAIMMSSEMTGMISPNMLCEDECVPINMKSNLDVEVVKCSQVSTKEVLILNQSTCDMDSDASSECQSDCDSYDSCDYESSVPLRRGPVIISNEHFHAGPFADVYLPLSKSIEELLVNVDTLYMYHIDCDDFFPYEAPAQNHIVSSMQSKNYRCTVCTHVQYIGY
jgi:hypothetical protein